MHLFHIMLMQLLEIYCRNKLYESLVLFQYTQITITIHLRNLVHFIII